MVPDKSIIPLERIERLIYLVRGQKVMLSADLARLYGVEPRVLVQAVKRNRARFPSDFMFQLTPQELANLKSQFVISSWGGSRATPYAFTEQGVVGFDTRRSRTGSFTAVALRDPMGINNPLRVSL